MNGNNDDVPVTTIKAEPNSPVLFVDAEIEFDAVDNEIKGEPLSTVLPRVKFDDVPPYYDDRDWILHLTKDQLPAHNKLQLEFDAPPIPVQDTAVTGSDLFESVNCSCMILGRFAYLCDHCPICNK